MLRRTLLSLSLTMALTLAGCSDDGTKAGSAIEGNYGSTTFTVTMSGQSAVDVLGAGGGLNMTVAQNLFTTGSLNIPASVAGNSLVASMEGTAEVDGNSVTFNQSADTFVRDLTWTHAGNTLKVTNQTISGVTYNIVLTRQ